jgi:hypothetical protein
MGSLDVCCSPGKEIRRAMRALAALGDNETVQVLHFARSQGRPLPGNTPEEQLGRYVAAGQQMASPRFCLVPAGDNEVSCPRLDRTEHSTAGEAASAAGWR